LCVSNKDDLFDYTDEAIGKPTGIDIKEQKHRSCLNTCTAKEKSWLINSIKTTIKIKKESVIAFCQRQQRSTLRRDKNG
jgi:octaprenyl-diphosphate synthase